MFLKTMKDRDISDEDVEVVRLWLAGKISAMEGVERTSTFFDASFRWLVIRVVKEALQSGRLEWKE